MGLKYAVGAFANSALHSMLSSRAFPLTRYFPRGKSWLYDVQRFAGTRDITIAFDVGANEGQTAGELLRFLPNAQIYCFEPVSRTYDLLTKNYGSKKNVTCINQALGAAPAKATMRLRRESGYNSILLTETGAEYLTGESEKIEVNTIDLFCTERGIKQIDILKMDVQGYELKVIEGAQQTIAAGNIRFVYAEVGFRPNNLEIQMFGELNDAMSQRGFLFSGFYEHLRYGNNKEFTLFANALYINPDFHAI